MASATIKVFLVQGDAKGLRTAEISNWSGKAIAAPRTELKEMLDRDEMDRAGVYVLLGRDPATDELQAYIGESDALKSRLAQHRDKEFWVTAIAFFSKDENLTKGHVRYLESRVWQEAHEAGRYELPQRDLSDRPLPESDRADMEEYLGRMRLLLPVLGCDLLSPIASRPADSLPEDVLYARIKGAEARGQRTAEGFIVYQGSTAVPKERDSAPRYPNSIKKRRELIETGVLVRKAGHLEFTRDVVFSSPSAAAAVIHGGSANGMTAWVRSDGMSLKDVES